MSLYTLKKEGKVVVIDSSGAGRTLMAEILRGAGFVDVAGVPSVREALALLETEEIEWVISSLYPDQPENAIHLLEIVTRHLELKNVKVSLLLEKDESFIIPLAYELGMLNHFSKPYTKDSFKEEIAELLKRLDANKNNLSIVAGTYLRPYLHSQSQFDDLEALEKNLITQFPVYSDLLVNLVPVYVAKGDKEKAKAILKQYVMIDKANEEKAVACCQSYLNGEHYNTSSGETALNFLGVERILVVDADDSMQKLVIDALQEFGVKDIVAFADGESALDYLSKNPELDLIIQEWRIPKVSGPLFLQRVKASTAKSCPIIIISSLLKPQDIPLVREMGVSDIIKKPVDRQELVRSFIWTIQQFRAPTEQWPMERKMRMLLSTGKTQEAQELKDRYLTLRNLPRASKNLMEAEFAFASRNFEKCRDYCVDSLKEAGDSITTLNLLGKALMHLRDFKMALKCFDKAQQLSPMNIERLCTMAEAQSEMGDEKAASETISGAKDIDPDSPRIAEAETKIAINSGDLEQARKLMAELDLLDNVISYMNNQAVAMARCDMFDEGIEIYKKTIESIPEGKEEVKPIIVYNMALALARQGNWEAARDQLAKIETMKTSRVTKKAAHLLNRIKKALETGSEISLTSTNPKPTKEAAEAEKEQVEAEEAGRPIVSAVDIKQGEIGLYKMFKAQNADNKALKLREAPPRFKLRSAIARSEAFGAEKVNKAG